MQLRTFTDGYGRVGEALVGAEHRRSLGRGDGAEDVVEHAEGGEVLEKRGARVNLVSVAFFLCAPMMLVPGSCLAFRCERFVSGPSES